jgi:hypothetical protein
VAVAHTQITTVLLVVLEVALKENRQRVVQVQVDRVMMEAVFLLRQAQAQTM